MNQCGFLWETAISVFTLKTFASRKFQNATKVLDHKINYRIV